MHGIYIYIYADQARGGCQGVNGAAVLWRSQTGRVWMMVSPCLWFRKTTHPTAPTGTCTTPLRLFLSSEVRRQRQRRRGPRPDQPLQSLRPVRREGQRGGDRGKAPDSVGGKGWREVEGRGGKSGPGARWKARNYDTLVL